MTDADVTIDGLPSGLAARRPTAADATEVSALLDAHQRAAKGSAGVDPEAVLGQLVGTGSWTRRQVLVHDRAGQLVAWLSVHDRASGRTLVEVTVTPDLPDEDAADPGRRAVRRRGASRRRHRGDARDWAPRCSTPEPTPTTRASSAGWPPPASSAPAPGCR